MQSRATFPPEKNAEKKLRFSKNIQKYKNKTNLRNRNQTQRVGRVGTRLTVLRSVPVLETGLS